MPDSENNIPPVWKDGQGADRAAEVESKYVKWRTDKKNHEQSWYINASMVRGLQRILWNDVQQKVQIMNAPSHRQTIIANRMLAKYKARQAKFVENRPEPFVIPASGDRDDKLNAEATKKALEYVLRKQQWTKKYRSTLHWANTCAKGFVWCHWNPNVKALTGQLDEFGSMQWAEVEGAGDVELEVGSPFEVLVSDPGIPNICDQPEIMRVKLRELKEIQARYPTAADIKGEVSTQEIFQYQQQIATLNSRGTSGYTYASSSESKNDPAQWVIVKELFKRPCSDYPKGYYCVVAAGQLLDEQQELPFGFADTNDPYPVVEFPDMELVGQFWPTTMVEQMISLQREYNMLRSKLSESIRLGAGPKLMSPLQSQVPKNAWNSEPWEHIRYQWYPGLPKPEVVQMPAIVSDVWNCIRLVKDEFDEITNIYPSSQGAPGGATSGFQTNLLQEATSSVHMPDIQLHEEAFKSLCYKIRHLMQMYYDVPRMLAVTGRDMIPQSITFSRDKIDENAEIIVQTKTALSSSPAVRTQQVIELWKAGILGNQGEPKAQVKALKLIDANGIGELQEENRRDEELARYEIDLMNGGDTSKEPQPYDDHDIHWTVHTDFMKSFEYLGLPPEVQQLHKVHLVLHAKFIDPAKSVQLSLDLGLQDLANQLKMMIQPPQAPQPGANGPQGPPQASAGQMPSPQAPPVALPPISNPGS